eukprot:1700305-Prymnesium_polylepis.1
MRLFVDDLYKEMDANGDNRIAFADFHAWILGLEPEPLRKARAISSWELTETKPESLRRELAGLMHRDRIQVVDLFDRCAIYRDGAILGTEPY